MTLQDLLLLSKQSPEYIAAYYLVIQLCVVLLPFLHGNNSIKKSLPSFVASAFFIQIKVAFAGNIA